jgi:hypothetical protein
LREAEGGGGMKPTRGKLLKWNDEPQMLLADGLQRVANVFSSALTFEEQQANADLIVAAWNAAKEINQENPLAAEEAMPEIFRLLLAVVVDARRICGKKLDLDEWLKQADEAIDKAMKEAA